VYSVSKNNTFWNFEKHFLVLFSASGKSYDRHGRKYWFIARRIFVEESGSQEEIGGSEETIAWENLMT